MMLMTNDTIYITFAPIKLFDLLVSVSLFNTYPGSKAIRIPGSEWYLEASMQNGA